MCPIWRNLMWILVKFVDTLIEILVIAEILTQKCLVLVSKINLPEAVSYLQKNLGKIIFQSTTTRSLKINLDFDLLFGLAGVLNNLIFLNGFSSNEFPKSVDSITWNSLSPKKILEIHKSYPSWFHLNLLSVNSKWDGNWISEWIEIVLSAYSSSSFSDDCALCELNCLFKDKATF